MNIRSKALGLLSLFTALLCSSLASAPARAAELLPAFKTGDIILFQGDSITDGGRQREGNDYNHTMGQDYAYIIAARLSALLPERHLTFLNRGNSGNKISDLAGHWKQDTLDLKPDILSILIGINDNGAHVLLPEFEQTYDKVLAETVAALPKVRLVLCTPFTLPVGNRKDNFTAWDAEVKSRAAIIEKLAAKYHAAVVRLQPLLDAGCKKAPGDYWIWDGIHPNYAGHALLADEWLRVVNAAYGQ